MRTIKVLLLSVVATVLAAGPALACGGLVAPNGAVNLLRTTTLAAYVDGVEHYVTSFEFAGGGGGKFGSIVPLPDVPTDVTRAGRWTLQRLVDEVRPPVVLDGLAFAAAESRSATVIMEKRVSALDIAVLEGGGDQVGTWAKENGFSLPPDAPEVLDFYARRSPIFMAVRFNLERAEAKNLQVGEGIPVHVTIPTDRPWVPLRILGLGREPDEVVEADVFLLNENKPELLPSMNPAGSTEGLVLERSEPASKSMLTDLASDRGMDWLPTEDMWLDYIRINVGAGELDHDLAINVNGGSPSRTDAGLYLPDLPISPEQSSSPWAWVLAGLTTAAIVLGANRVASRK